MKYIKNIGLLIGIITALFMPLAYPLQVFAATETLTVDAEGHYTDGAYVGGAGTWANLNSDDGNTSYLNVVGTLSIPLKHFYSFSASAATSITSVQLYYKVQWQSAGDDAVKTYARIGGVDYYKNLYTISDTTYALFSETWTTNPATGDVWTSATINACEFGLEFSGTYRWTYAYIIVNYTSSSFPVVLTLDTTIIGLTSATFNGEVTDYGAATIDDRGFVWDTVSHVNPGNVDHAATAYANNYAEIGTWTIGTFSYSAAVLVADTTYYIRACAHNSIGWVYGDELIFKTIGTPVVTLLSGTNVSINAAQLNSIIGYDGNQLCDVRWGYDTVTHAGNFAAYANISDWTLDTYDTGSYPYLELSGLVANTTYFFNIQVRNDFATVEGTELTFTTLVAGTLAAPTNCMAKPEMNALNLSWTKGTSSSGTLIRWSLASYPVAITDGGRAYEGVDSSFRLIGVPSGRTVYLTFWSYSNGTFSATGTNVLTTTLAANTTDSVTALPSPKQINNWMIEPSSANLQKLPGHQLVSQWDTDYSMPETTAWFIVGIVLSVIFAGFVWAFDDNHSSFGALIALCIGLGGGVAAGIFAGWMLAFVVLLGIGAIAISWRA